LVTSAAVGARGIHLQHALRRLAHRHAGHHAAVHGRPVRMLIGALGVEVHAVAQPHRHHVGHRGRDVQRLQVPQAGDRRTRRPDAAVDADRAARALLGDEARRQNAAVRGIDDDIAVPVLGRDVVGRVHGHDAPARTCMQFGLRAHAQSRVSPPSGT
jgi:hypothetical protein